MNLNITRNELEALIRSTVREVLQTGQTNATLTKQELADRWRITVRSLDRIRDSDPLFPDPLFKNKRVLRWKLEHIEAYEDAKQPMR